MGQSISSGNSTPFIPFDIALAIFVALETACAEGFYDEWVPENLLVLQKTLDSLTRVSIRSKALVGPLLFRHLYLNLSNRDHLALLREAVFIRPHLLEGTRKAIIYGCDWIYQEDPPKTDLEEDVRSISDILKRATQLQHLKLIDLARKSMPGLSDEILSQFSEHSSLTKLEFLGEIGYHISLRADLPPLPHLTHLRFNHSSWCRLDPSALPSLHSLCYDIVPPPPHLHLLDGMAPRIRHVTLRNNSATSYDECVCAFPHLEHFHLITSSAMVFDLKEAFPSATATALPPVPIVEFDLPWRSTTIQTRQDVLKFLGNIFYCSRMIKKLIVNIAFSKKEQSGEEIDTPLAIAEEARQMWEKEGVELEVNIVMV